MALITCPSCGKAVSDEAKKCVHCGAELKSDSDDSRKDEEEDVIATCPDCGGLLYDTSEEACPYCGRPIMSEVDLRSSQEDSESKVKAAKAPAVRKNKIIKIVVAVVLAVAVVVVASVCVVQDNLAKQAEAEAQQFNEYVSNMSAASTAMLNGAADSESMCNQVSKIWNAAIYDKKQYKWGSDIQKYYSTDFNEAIAKYYADDSTRSAVSSLKSNQSKVSDLMNKLSDPPEGTEIAYNTLTDLYDEYLTLTGLALSPSGSLQTFNTNFQNADDSFSNTLKKLQSQIPDNKTVK